MKPNAPLGWKSWEAKDAAEELMRQQGQWVDKDGIVRKGIPPRKEGRQ